MQTRVTLHFTVAPNIQSIRFNLLFASAEFPEFVGDGDYNDVFGEFLDGEQISFDTNDKPLTVNTNFFRLNNSENTDYPDITQGKTVVTFDTNYGGLTPALTTRASLDTDVPDGIHTLKFVIADTGDDAVDSGIFLANLTGDTGTNTGTNLTPTVTVTDVDSTATSGTYGVGAVIPIRVSFNEIVTVDGGVPELKLNDGGTAFFASGSDTTTLTFNYTVAAGENTADLDYLSMTALTLPEGSTIRDVTGIDADLTLPPVATDDLAARNLVINTPPIVTGVSTTATGATYGVGTEIPITVIFSENVTFSGSPPELVLNDGGKAVYVTGNGTSTLIFNYRVARGEHARLGLHQHHGINAP